MTLVYVLAAVASGLVSLGVIYKKLVKPLLDGAKDVRATYTAVGEQGQRLTTVEKQTRQLTTNGGGHVADVVHRTESTLLRYVRTWDEQQAALHEALVAEKSEVKAALEAQAQSVRLALEVQSSDMRDAFASRAREVDAEFLKVWRTLAIRGIERASTEFDEAADRAERLNRREPTDGDGHT